MTLARAAQIDGAQPGAAAAKARTHAHMRREITPSLTGPGPLIRFGDKFSDHSLHYLSIDHFLGTGENRPNERLYGALSTFSGVRSARLPASVANLYNNPE